MIVDSSAVIAVLLDEPEAVKVAGAFASAARVRMAAPNWLETCMVFKGRQGTDSIAGLERMRHRLRIEVVPFDFALAEIARSAFATYGKGTQHPAKLKFGDCMAYALAKQTGEPLLFKGQDFTHTDIAPALA